LSEGTKFSAVNLLNGGLSGTVGIGTNSVGNNGTALAATNNGALFALNESIAEGDTISINGFTFGFTNSDQGTSAAAGKVSIARNAAGAPDVANTMANVVAFLNSSTDARLSNLKFSSAVLAGANLQGVGLTAAGSYYQLQANWAGGAMQSNYTVNVSTSTSNVKVGDALARTIGNTVGAAFMTISGATTATGTVNMTIGAAITNGDVDSH